MTTTTKVNLPFINKKTHPIMLNLSVKAPVFWDQEAPTSCLKHRL